jgi:multimeric flavodoxin WrbA
MTLLLTL